MHDLDLQRHLLPRQREGGRKKTSNLWATKESWLENEDHVGKRPLISAKLSWIGDPVARTKSLPRTGSKAFGSQTSRNPASAVCEVDVESNAK